MNRIKLFLPLILALLLGIALYFGLKQDPHKLGLSLLDKPLPTFIADDLLSQNKKITPEDFNGHITVLNVWASWCPSCKSEFPFLFSLNEQADFQVYGLNYRDGRNAALGVLSELGNPYVLSVYDPDGKLALDLGVYGTPETYLIDSQGVIRYRYSGELNQEIWRKEFQPKIQALIQGAAK